MTQSSVSPDDPWTLVEPNWKSGPDYHVTLGPEVADLAAHAGFAPDPEQELALDMLFGVDETGKAAAFEAGIIACRQNLKTGLFKQAALGWLFVTEQRLTIWSAHEFSTAQEAFRDMENLIGSKPSLSKRVKKTYNSASNTSIELKNGQRLNFKARTTTGGRGLTGDKVVLDEAFALTRPMLGALIPTLSARPDPQVVYGSSAGLRSSEPLRKVRDRGRAGSSRRLIWLEWGAPRLACVSDKCDHEWGSIGCQLDKVENWKLGNPLLGRIRANGTGLTLEYVQSEREALPPDEFGRERCGWWDDPSASELFGPKKWENGGREDRPAELAIQAFGIAVSMDLTSAAIVAGAIDGEDAWMKPLQHGPKTNWVVEKAKALQDTYGATCVVDGRGPAAVLIPHLETAGVRVHTASTSDVLDACATLETKVTDGQLLHTKATELNDAVIGAVKRPVGDRWALGRKDATSDITPLEAGTLAIWLAGVEVPQESAYEEDDLMVV